MLETNSERLLKKSEMANYLDNLMDIVDEASKRIRIGTIIRRTGYIKILDGIKPNWSMKGV